ncbi:hypothetical protein KBC04_04490 [Candidatus Babeliales bacterium]|nr:hypothetical protein [Candidatus Babeliales bacterium]MBP9844079.1 hypothetical protein [Candidatus Babeliales bacterium]
MKFYKVLMVVSFFINSDMSLHAIEDKVVLDGASPEKFKIAKQALLARVVSDDLTLGCFHRVDGMVFRTTCVKIDMTRKDECFLTCAQNVLFGSSYKDLIQQNGYEFKRDSFDFKNNGKLSQVSIYVHKTDGITVIEAFSLKR